MSLTIGGVYSMIESQFSDQSELLGKILEKCFTHLFYLNGAAAVSILAFVANIISGKNDSWFSSLCWIKWALIWFSIGAMVTVFTELIAYISQSYFYDKAENEMKSGRNFSNNIDDKGNYILEKEGVRVRKWAIVFFLLTLCLFGAGIYCSFEAFSNF